MRVAVAVEEQTRSLRRNFMFAGGALVALGVMGFVFWQRQASARERELMTMFAKAESTMVALQQKTATPQSGDSTYSKALRDTLQARLSELAQAREQLKSGKATSQGIESLSHNLDRATVMQQSISAVSKVHELNDGAVAMLASDFDGKFLAGTAFGITPSGLMVTNRHTVRSEAGAPAQRMMVIFANTKKWLRVKVVRVSDTDDLALLQVEDPGTYPVVAGVSRTGAAASVGAPVASIGYPGATDTPMEGSGMNITARTTSTPGTVSKRLDDVIQIDSYAGHGSQRESVVRLDWERGRGDLGWRQGIERAHRVCCPSAEARGIHWRGRGGNNSITRHPSFVFCLRVFLLRHAYPILDVNVIRARLGVPWR